MQRATGTCALLSPLIPDSYRLDHRKLWVESCRTKADEFVVCQIAPVKDRQKCKPIVERSYTRGVQSGGAYEDRTGSLRGGSGFLS
jgi:hypothetical protein